MQDSRFLTMEEVKRQLIENIIGWDKQLLDYSAVLSCISSAQVSQWLTEVNARTKVSDSRIFDVISEFLQISGQPALLSQCLQLKSDLFEVQCEQTELTIYCLQLLYQFTTIIRLHPPARLEKNRISCYRRWASAILQHMSPQIITKVKLEMKEEFYSADTNTLISQQALQYSNSLQKTLQDEQANLTKIYECSKNYSLADVELLLSEVNREISKAIDKCPVALECVIITALCNLNERLLMMETTAASNGNWILEDLIVTTSTAIKMISCFPGLRCEVCTEVLLVHTILRSLHEFLINFETIILPECLRTILVGENSVLTIVAQLSHITNSTPIPLSELLHQLSLHLQCVIMEMPSPHINTLQAVKVLEEQFRGLTKIEEANYSKGQMLLMTFNGLFKKLLDETSQFFSSLGNLQVASIWNRVDQIHKGKTFAVLVWKKEFQEVVNDMFLLKQLQTMENFFSLCTIMRDGFIGGADAPTVALNNTELCRPMKMFISDFLGRRLLGVFSHTLAVTICHLLERSGLNVTSEVTNYNRKASIVALEELCHKNVKQNLERGSLNSSALSQASSIVSHCENAWRNMEVAQQLTQDIEMKKNTVDRLQLQYTAHYWLHEDVLTIHNLPGPPLRRADLMLDLRKTTTALIALQVKLEEVREGQSNLITTVKESLQYAVEANPALTDILSAFETNVLTESERIGSEEQLAAAVAGVCSTFLHHEALRTRTKEALANDAAFMRLIEKCDDAIYLSINTHGLLTTLEKDLLNLIHSEEFIKCSWLEKAETLISGCTMEVRNSIDRLQLAVFETHNKVNICVANLQKVTDRTIADISCLLEKFTDVPDEAMDET